MARTDRPFFTRYLIWLISTLLALSLVLIGILVILQDQLPPPPFTGSVSFDEKAVWLEKHLDTPCEILAIGSSMSVNNLDSSLFPPDTFLNASSWGMKISQTDHFLKILLKHVDPKTIIMITAPTDFEFDYRGQAIVDEAKLDQYFTRRNLVTTHLQNLSLTYMVREFRGLQRDRQGRQTYYSLDFDSGGSVPLASMSEGFERIEQRWMKPVASESMIDPNNYAALSTLVRRCTDAGKAFHLIQAPIRKDILSAADSEFLTQRHWPELAKQAQATGGSFHNFHGKLTLSSDAFADSTHLNRTGAQRLSKAILALLNTSPKQPPHDHGE